MKLLLTTLLLLLTQVCKANMASPIWEGTSGSAAISSRDIDIIRETIVVTIDKDFNTAAYVIEYHINTDSGGRQIPLLFCAKDFESGFNVWVDGAPIALLKVPDGNNAIVNTRFARFDRSFKPLSEGEYGTVEIKWSDRKTERYLLDELKYFEADLAKGSHVIRVEYKATVSVNREDWVEERSFDYSLSPAKYWRSFGGLEITVNASEFGNEIKSNTGQPTSGSTKGVAVWKFDKLPADYFNIIYKPEPNSFAKLLIGIGPMAMMIIIGIIILLLHTWAVYKFRKRTTTKWSWVVIVGGLVIPFVILISYMLSDLLIDAAIGPAASGRHGYDFMLVMYYPFLMPAYLLVMLLLDYVIKRKLWKKDNQSIYKEP